VILGSRWPAGLAVSLLMCDYSLHCVESRPAKTGETLVVSNFPGTWTRGFACPRERWIAVCLRPGTEVAFEKDVCRKGVLFWRRLGYRVARFRQVELDNSSVHHDALEFPNGIIVKLNDLKVGQRARIVQLPAEVKANKDGRRDGTREKVEVMEF
jgi:hypothetical protein